MAKFKTLITTDNNADYKYGICVDGFFYKGPIPEIYPETVDMNQMADYLLESFQDKFNKDDFMNNYRFIEVELIEYD